MENFSINIKVGATDHFDKLIEEFGGKDNVSISISRDKCRVIKSAMLDETLIIEPAFDEFGIISNLPKSAQDLAQDIYDAHDPSASAVIVDKTNRITDKFVSMLIETRAPSVRATFGTEDEMSAFFYREVWRDMQSNPSRWSSLGLTASLNTTSFNPGDALNTDQKCINYGAECETLAWDFATSRMVELENFKIEKAIIDSE